MPPQVQPPLVDGGPAACATCGAPQSASAMAMVFCPCCGGRGGGGGGKAAKGGAGRRSLSALGMIRSDAAGPPEGLGAHRTRQKRAEVQAAASCTAADAEAPLARVESDAAAARVEVVKAERHARGGIAEAAALSRRRITWVLKERAARRRIADEERRLRAEVRRAHRRPQGLPQGRGRGGQTAAPVQYAPTPPDSAYATPRAGSPSAGTADPFTDAPAAGNSGGDNNSTAAPPPTASAGGDSPRDALEGCRGQLLLEALAAEEDRLRAMHERVLSSPEDGGGDGAPTGPPPPHFNDTLPYRAPAAGRDDRDPGCVDGERGGGGGGDPLAEASTFTDAIKACVDGEDMGPGRLDDPKPSQAQGGSAKRAAPKRARHQQQTAGSAAVRSKTSTDGAGMRRGNSSGLVKTLGPRRSSRDRVHDAASSAGAPASQARRRSGSKPLPHRFQSRTGISSRMRTSTTTSVLLPADTDVSKKPAAAAAGVTQARAPARSTHEVDACASSAAEAAQTHPRGPPHQQRAAVEMRAPSGEPAVPEAPGADGTTPDATAADAGPQGPTSIHRGGDRPATSPAGHGRAGPMGSAACVGTPRSASLSDPAPDLPPCPPLPVEPAAAASPLGSCPSPPSSPEEAPARAVGGGNSRDGGVGDHDGAPATSKPDAARVEEQRERPNDDAEDEGPTPPAAESGDDAEGADTDTESDGGRSSLASSSCLPDFLSDTVGDGADGEDLGEDELAGAKVRRLWWEEAGLRGELARAFVTGLTAMRLRLREDLLFLLLTAREARFDAPPAGAGAGDVGAAGGRTLFDAMMRRRRESAGKAAADEEVQGASPTRAQAREPAREVQRLVTLETTAREAIHDTFLAGLSELRLRHREAVAFGVQVFYSSISNCSEVPGGTPGGVFSPLDAGFTATPLGRTFSRKGDPSDGRGFAHLETLNDQHLHTLRGSRTISAEDCTRRWDHWSDRRRRRREREREVEVEGGHPQPRSHGSSTTTSSRVSSARSSTDDTGTPLDVLARFMRRASSLSEPAVRRSSSHEIPFSAVSSGVSSFTQATPGPPDDDGVAPPPSALLPGGGRGSGSTSGKPSRRAARRGRPYAATATHPTESMRPLSDDEAGNEQLFSEIFGAAAGGGAATGFPRAHGGGASRSQAPGGAYDAENDLAASAQRGRANAQAAAGKKAAAAAKPQVPSFSMYGSAGFPTRRHDGASSRVRSTTTPVGVASAMDAGTSGIPPRTHLCALQIDPKTFEPNLHGRLYCIQSHASAERGKDEALKAEKSGAAKEACTAWADTAAGYLEAGDYHDALKAAQSALRLDNQQHGGHIAAATAHVALLQLKKARNQCEVGRGVRPITAEVLKEYRAVTETAEAVENSLARAARPRPTDLDRRLALKFAEAALLRYPSSQKPLALHLLRLESMVYTRPRESVAIIQKLIDTLPPRGDLQMLMGQAILFSCKDDISVGNARSHLRRALEIDPSLNKAKDIIDKSERLQRVRGDIKDALAHKKWHQAKLLLAKAIGIDAENNEMVGALRLQRAEACCHLNDFETGIRECCAVLQVDSRNVAAYELRSKLHLKLNHMDAAQADLEAAQRLSGKDYDFSVFDKTPGIGVGGRTASGIPGRQRAAVRPEQCAACMNYLLLNLDVGTSDAKAIAKAYRAVALTTHPDRVPPEKRADAERRFKDISHAYTTLTTPNLKSTNDLAHTCNRSLKSKGRR